MNEIESSPEMYISVVLVHHQIAKSISSFIDRSRFQDDEQQKQQLLLQQIAMNLFSTMTYFYCPVMSLELIYIYSKTKLTNEKTNKKSSHFFLLAYSHKTFFGFLFFFFFIFPTSATKKIFLLIAIYKMFFSSFFFFFLYFFFL